MPRPKEEAAVNRLAAADRRLLSALLVGLISIAILAGYGLSRSLGGSATPPRPIGAASADPDGEAGEGGDPDEYSAGKRGSGKVDPAISSTTGAGSPVSAPAAPTSGGFSTQVRLGYTVGDQWEPAIAADRFGHVYMLYAQYGGVPGCGACLSPTQVLQISLDHGSTWSAPRQFDEGVQGWDSQVVVDPVDGRTVWAAWLARSKSDIVVAKSTDFGATWTEKVVDSTNAGTDKPILAVRGNNAYVAYDHTQTVWVSYTHDGGATWTSVKSNSTSGNGKIGWSLATGGTVAPNGDVHFSWDGYTQNGGAKGPVNLYVTTSRDGGLTWTDQLMDVSGSPPDCSADLCGWAYLGAAITMTSDAGGTLYALWNSSPTGTKEAPEDVWFSRSTDGGRTWAPKVDVSLAPAAVNHAFPSIAAGAAGDVRIAWMDARVPGGSLWNVYYRSSTNGGSTWAAEQDISSAVSGYAYIQPAGFEYPFGDYFELAIDEAGTTHAVFGEGLNYDSPGSVWYTRGR
jgi:BNR repeat protein